MTSSAPSAAPRRDSASAPRSASLATWTGALVPSASAMRATSGTSVQPRLGAVRTRPSSRRTTPATARPMPMSDPASSGPGWTARASAARSVTTRSTRAWPRGRSTRRMRDDLTGRPDVGGRQRVDGDLEGQHRGDLAIERDDGRRAARKAEWRGLLLAHDAGGLELADMAADGAAGQSRAGDQLRARERSTIVQRAHDHAQVGTSDGLAALAGLKGSHDRWSILGLA